MYSQMTRRARGLKCSGLTTPVEPGVSFFAGPASSEGSRSDPRAAVPSSEPDRVRKARRARSTSEDRIEDVSVMVGSGKPGRIHSVYCIPETAHASIRKGGDPTEGPLAD